MPLFDTHAHYNDDAFDQNRKGLLDALPDAGVGAVVIPGVDVESSRSALALAAVSYTHLDVYKRQAVLLSGPEDLITDGARVWCVTGGSGRMSLVTGTGCRCV